MPAKFGPWLAGIVRNLALDACRARANRRALDAGAGGVPDGAAPGAGPLDELGRREESCRVAAALGGLDEVSRSAVVLRYYDGLSSKQIGELLGLAPAAVDMRLMRARRQLRDRLAEPDDAAEPRPRRA
jgi:RNA polymerase sigma factor (sigma-70 family)